MMRSSAIFSLLISSLLLFACSKADNSVRFKNDFKQSIDNVLMGNASFGTIDPGKISDYKSVSSRSFVISGTSASGQQLSSSETVAKKGKHKWTVTLSSAGAISIAEDPI